MSLGPEKQSCKYMQGDFAAQHSHGDVGACNVTIVYTNHSRYTYDKPLSQYKVSTVRSSRDSAPRLNHGHVRSPTPRRLRPKPETARALLPMDDD
jgi:hypothetical protein